MTAKPFLGLDLGGTKVAAGVVTPDGRVLSHVREATSALRADGDPLRGILRLGREAVRAADASRLEGVGIALPGPADAAGLRLIQAPTIPELEGIALEAPLRAAFGAPVSGDNDANACALAESRFGAARGSRSMVYFTVSTGIGGGIVVEGELYRGSRGTSAELGHQAILPLGGPACDCGGSGCLEALASGRGIARRARESMPERGELTAVEIAELARAGDPTALRIWDETALYLGLGVANAINVLDPEVVVLGGGVAVGAADLLLEPVREVVRTRCMPILRREVPIRVAALGAEVGIVGAAALAM
ncbi:MAG: ROK family protein [Armatimonadota bacterium]